MKGMYVAQSTISFYMENYSDKITISISISLLSSSSSLIQMVAVFGFRVRPGTLEVTDIV